MGHTTQRIGYTHSRVGAKFTQLPSSHPRGVLDISNLNALISHEEKEKNETEPLLLLLYNYD